VGCPAGVADAYAAGHIVKVKKLVYFVDFALILFNENFAVTYGGDANGVIAAVFKPFKRRMN
jgi:hypothetical protein